MSTAIATLTDLDLFFQQLPLTENRLLLMDYDGTLAPFQSDRKCAVPYPGIPELLDYITCNCNTELILVSARAAQEIARLLGPQLHPEIWGCYGMEHLSSDGQYEVGYISPRLQTALSQAVLQLEGAGLGEFIERKVSAVAIHWRGVPPKYMEEIRTTGYRCLSPLACVEDLLLVEFDGGLELRTRSSDKGELVRRILASRTENTSVAYLGDDYADEDAFRVVNDYGLSVLVRQEYRATAAQEWLKPPRELARFLTRWIRVCGGEK